MDDNHNPNHVDSTFEIALRILGNEIFAISIQSDSINKKWIVYSVIITALTLFAISTVGDDIARFTRNIYSAVDISAPE